MKYGTKLKKELMKQLGKIIGKEEGPAINSWLDEECQIL
jgi:hypothetical protein